MQKSIIIDFIKNIVQLEAILSCLGTYFWKEHKKCFSAVIVLWWMMPIAQVLFQQWNSLLKRRIIELVENKNVHDVYEIWSIALTLCNNNLLDTLFLFDLKNFPALARIIN